MRNIKRVFSTYRGICDAYEDVTILFFNEADGIFSKRSTRSQQYCDKEENAMQNIILQELEEFDGILIATTTGRNVTTSPVSRRSGGLFITY